MKLAVAFAVFFFTSFNVWAQFDNPTNNSIEFEVEDNNVNSPTGFEIPATKKPSLSNQQDPFDPKNASDFGGNKPEPLDITKGDGLLEYKTNKAPKYFTKDKEAKEEYGRDQALGEVTTNGAFVNVVYRDHEYVDGDRIRVMVNDDVVQSDITLGGSFQGFDLPLQKGLNTIEFIALNQGSSGPNTAELHVYDDDGILISAQEWNLLTGRKATITVIKN